MKKKPRKAVRRGHPHRGNPHRGNPHRGNPHRGNPHIRNQLNHHDPRFLDRLIPVFHLLERYFRYESVGIENIPDNRGCLVVMNHGIIPFHGFLLTKHLIQRHGVYPRGLGAGFLFDLPLVKWFFLKGGAVNANNRNATTLLRQKNCVMLAPGGIYEGLICRPGMKRIPWERRKGFVRLAVATGAPIIPTYCHGINEVYYNSDFLLWWRIKFLEATRFSMPLFFGIGLLPFPKKLFHVVGRPIPTTRKNGETETQAIKRVHATVMEAMKRLAE